MIKYNEIHYIRSRTFENYAYKNMKFDDAEQMSSAVFIQCNRRRDSQAKSKSNAISFKVRIES